MRSSGRSIVFVINSLTAGGAEGALVNLLGNMEDYLRGYDTHLVLLDIEEERHAVPAWVQKHLLDARHSLVRSAVRLTRLLRELAPAVTLSFLNRANCANVISAKYLGYPCVISERVHTNSHFGAGAIAAINKGIVRITYRLADQVLAVSEGVKEDLIANFGVSEEKVRVVHNPVDTDRICKQSLEAPAIVLPEAYIVGIGRLVPNKNFRLLVEAYRASGVREKLVILGEGSGRTELERLITSLGMRRRVMLAGYVQNPYPIIKGARLFVSSSNAEGFPNALIEALALGCPVVATDCDAGPRDILAGRINARCSEVTLADYGILVPTNSTRCLANAIHMACRADIRTRYSQRGKERASDFGVRSSVEQYWSAIAPYTATA
jgi:N-acetylgalactosamine-N,N'-diacetylbacillosaminyl-diphospho-undecaprenol 4-alpha-N-acetylgalactosaminyltransferase